MDLKESVQELHNNETFKHILATLLAIGNFLNGKKVRGRGFFADDQLLVRRALIALISQPKYKCGITKLAIVINLYINVIDSTPESVVFMFCTTLISSAI